MTKPNFVEIAFDSPPNRNHGRFVEVESVEGRSMSFGTWIQKPDGSWVLRIYLLTITDIRDALAFLSWEEQERVFDRLGVLPF